MKQKTIKPVEENRRKDFSAVVRQEVLGYDTIGIMINLLE